MRRKRKRRRWAGEGKRIEAMKGPRISMTKDVPSEENKWSDELCGKCVIMWMAGTQGRRDG